MNLVFDLGGVVLKWDPDDIIHKLFSEPSVRRRLRAQVFAHPDWLELDRGTLDPEKAVDGFSQRTGLARKEIQSLMDLVPGSLTPIPGTVDLMHRLKERGHVLFCLSNMHLASAAFIKARYAFWHIFTGMVFSAHVKMIKPEPGIYRYLIETYELTPEHTVFIDDMPINLVPADQLGIHTILFKNPKDCERQLFLIDGI